MSSTPQARINGPTPGSGAGLARGTPIGVNKVLFEQVRTTPVLRPEWKECETTLAKERNCQQVNPYGGQVQPLLTPQGPTFVTKPPTMEYMITVLQIAVASSVVYVWIFRYHNVVAEFKQFGLSDVVRNAVGAAKTALATMLLVGIWYPPVVPLAAAGMAVFMLAAQVFHFKAGNPFIKKLPSLILFLLCAFILVQTMS